MKTHLLHTKVATLFLLSRLDDVTFPPAPPFQLFPAMFEFCNGGAVEARNCGSNNRTSCGHKDLELGMVSIFNMNAFDTSKKNRALFDH